MPSQREKKGFSYQRIESLIEGALEEVRSGRDIEALNECRSLFRRKTPLSLRAYVAAVLLLRASPGKAGGRRQEESDFGGRQGRGGKNERAVSESRNRAAGNEDRGRKAQSLPDERRPKRDDDTMPQGESRIKEGRYAGEGVTLFIGAGRRQHIYARHIFRLISEVPEANEENISPVRVLDNYSFIDTDPAVAEAIIQKLDGRLIRGRKLVVNLARKRGVADKPEDNGAEERPADDYVEDENAPMEADEETTDDQADFAGDGGSEDDRD